MQTPIEDKKGRQRGYGYKDILAQKGRFMKLGNMIEKMCVVTS